MRVLEFMPKDRLKPTGGPVGYLHGLYVADQKKNKTLSFLEAKTINKAQDDRPSSSIVRFKNKIREKLVFIKALFVGRRSKEIEKNTFDIIHFHTTLDLFYNRKSLKKFSGKTVLTSHSPTLAMKEVFTNWAFWEKMLFWPLYLMMKSIDYRAFKIADYIVFPCEQAEEPYRHAWKGFQKFKNNNKNKFKYLLTGTFPRKAKIQRSEVRSNYNIPDETFLLSYVGRHEKIKGYDLLKEIGSELFMRDDSVMFIVAGKEYPLKRPNSKKWIEVGWTSDPHSLIAASDLFVLPNRETYFDLILLEVLSLGKMVLVSKTGGNKFFDKPEFPGVFFYETIDDAVLKIQQIKEMNSVEKRKLEACNYKAFLNLFDNEVFYDNYLKMLDSIINN